MVWPSSISPFTCVSNCSPHVLRSKSDFCLCPYGDGFGARLPYMAVSGCIPVIVQVWSKSGWCGSGVGPVVCIWHLNVIVAVRHGRACHILTLKG